MISVKRNGQIEGLRGITILVIVFFHLIYRFNELYVGEVYKYKFMKYWGEIGVSIFLIISAYFLYDNSKESFNLITFYKKKFLRLWPTYFIAITAIFALTQVIELPGRTYTLVDYLQNIFFINGFIGIPYIDGSHWYLTILISLIFVYGLISKFKLQNYIWTYFCWLFLSLFLKVIRKIVPLWIFDVLIKLIGGEFIGIAVMGIVLHMFCVNREDIKKQKINTILIIIFSIIYSIIFLTPMRVFGAIIGIILVFLCNYNYLNILYSKVLIYVGSISYPIYLIHQNISYIIENILLDFFGKYNLFFPVIAFLGIFLLAVLLSIFERKISRYIVASGFKISKK